MEASLKIIFSLSMASKCDFGITWVRGLGITLATKQEVIMLTLHVRFRRRWGDRGEQGFMMEIGPRMFAVYRMIAPQSWTCLFYKFMEDLPGLCVLGLFLLYQLCESDASHLWQNPSLRASRVPKERRVTGHVTGFSVSGGSPAFCVLWEVYYLRIYCRVGPGPMLVRVK